MSISSGLYDLNDRERLLLNATLRELVDVETARLGDVGQLRYDGDLRLYETVQQRANVTNWTESRKHLTPFPFLLEKQVQAQCAIHATNAFFGFPLLDASNEQDMKELWRRSGIQRNIDDEVNGENLYSDLIQAFITAFSNSNEPLNDYTPNFTVSEFQLFLNRNGKVDASPRGLVLSSEERRLNYVIKRLFESNRFFLLLGSRHDINGGHFVAVRRVEGQRVFAILDSLQDSILLVNGRGFLNYLMKYVHETNYVKVIFDVSPKEFDSNDDVINLHVQYALGYEYNTVFNDSQVQDHAMYEFWIHCESAEQEETAKIILSEILLPKRVTDRELTQFFELLKIWRFDFDSHVARNERWFERESQRFLQGLNDDESRAAYYDTLVRLLHVYARTHANTGIVNAPMFHDSLSSNETTIENAAMLSLTQQDLVVSSELESSLEAIAERLNLNQHGTMREHITAAPPLATSTPQRPQQKVRRRQAFEHRPPPTQNEIAQRQELDDVSAHVLRLLELHRDLTTNDTMVIRQELFSSARETIVRLSSILDNIYRKERDNFTLPLTIRDRLIVIQTLYYNATRQRLRLFEMAKKHRLPKPNDEKIARWVLMVFNGGVN